MVDQLEPPESGGIRVRGRVKWFDPVKGFGFIVSNEIEGDVLIHRSVIQEYGSTTVLAEGAKVDVSCVQKVRGLQARKLYSVELDPNMGNGHAGAANGAKRAGRTREIVIPEAVGPAFEAECKWFSRPKGFGFVVATSGGDDVFVHMDTLRRCNVRELRQGQRVLVRVAQTERGLMATEINIIAGVIPPSDFEH
ncbi:MAG: CspA family cold shock protein [Alphaproteobacteria bacterium]|nr:CspA family cold shock protein [Alphaproteobacteria bacterium]